MIDIFSLEELAEQYPESVVDGQIVLETLVRILATEVSDLQDQMNEKDFQILRITERLEKLESNRP